MNSERWYIFVKETDKEWRRLKGPFVTAYSAFKKLDEAINGEIIGQPLYESFGIAVGLNVAAALKLVTERDPELPKFGEFIEVTRTDHISIEKIVGYLSSRYDGMLYTYSIEMLSDGSPLVTLSAVRDDSQRYPARLQEFAKRRASELDKISD